MRAAASKYGGDPEVWAVTGLLHDADYDQWPDEHPKRIVDWLRGAGRGREPEHTADYCPRCGSQGKMIGLEESPSPPQSCRSLLPPLFGQKRLHQKLHVCLADRQRLVGGRPQSRSSTSQY